MKLPRSVLEEMERQGQEPPADPPGGRAHARIEEERRRRGLPSDAADGAYEGDGEGAEPESDEETST